MSKIKVTLIKGNDHYQNVTDVLNLLSPQIFQKLTDVKTCVIKPNLISTKNQLASTLVDAVRAVLDFLTKIYPEKILIAENSALGDTFDGFRNFGYLDLTKSYNVEFVDLAKDTFSPFEITDVRGKKIKIGIAKTILEADFRISLTPPKTHDEVIITLSLKNMVMGSLDNRPLMHQGARATNLNLAKIAKIIPPHLSIIDGTTGMEGNGPAEGMAIESNFAVASLNPLAADVTACKIMGFKPSDIGYFCFLGLPKGEDIEVIGETINNCQAYFIPHRNFTQKLQWKKKANRLEKILIPIGSSVYLKIQKMPFYSSGWFRKVKELIKKILGY